MPIPLHTVTIYTLADMEACCRRWRELGANDETRVGIENNFKKDITFTLQYHYSGSKGTIQHTITLDQFPA